MTGTKLRVLVIDGKGKACKQGHDPSFNHKIQGTRKRFCTYIIGKYYGDKPLFCGDSE